MYLPACGNITPHIVEQIQKLLFILIYSSVGGSLIQVLDAYRCIAEREYLENTYAQDGESDKVRS